MTNIANNIQGSNNQAKLNACKIKTEITIRECDLIATQTVEALYSEAKVLKQQIDAQKLAYDDLIEKIQDYMGDVSVLLGSNGARLATQIVVKGSETVDKAALKMHFADVYEVVKKVGNPHIRFELK